MDGRAKEYAGHISGLCNVECNRFDIGLKSFVNAEVCFCASCAHSANYPAIHQYGCYEAARWGGKYIYYCPLGFIFIAVSLMNELDMVESGIIAGPVIMGHPDDFSSDIPNREAVPNLSAKQVNHLSEIMLALFAGHPRSEENSPEKFLNEMYRVLDVLPPYPDYPIELERELQKSLGSQNSEQARDILNQLLGQIFFHSNGDLAIIKKRVSELIVLLSRSAIDGGAEIEQALRLNDAYIKELEGLSTIDKISLWLGGVLNRFMYYMFEYRDVKHTDIIFKATGYIKENYMKKLSLDGIASHVYLSRSYLSKIFKQEMNVGLTEYINSLRIKKSKILLLDNSLSLADVANLVGFEDQSYFNKVFKQSTGVSPGKYRERHSR